MPTCQCSMERNGGCWVICISWLPHHCSGGSELEIKRRATFVCESMFTLDQNIWSSSVSLATKLWLHNACILPVFLYRSEVWSVTSMLSKKIDALDNWCLRWIMHIHWTDFVYNRSCLTLSVDIACPSSDISNFRSCQCQSRPFPSSSGVHSGSSQRLASQNWQTETI